MCALHIPCKRQSTNDGFLNIPRDHKGNEASVGIITHHNFLFIIDSVLCGRLASQDIYKFRISVCTYVCCGTKSTAGLDGKILKCEM